MSCQRNGRCCLYQVERSHSARRKEPQRVCLEQKKPKQAWQQAIGLLSGNKGLSVKCKFCEANFCRSCTKIDKVVFDAISANQGISWFCESCQTVPGV